MVDDDYQISSEIYSEYNYICNLKPTLNKHNVVSKFEFTYPQYQVTIDSDGDLEVPRKHKKTTNIAVIEVAILSSIESENIKKSTVLGLVGLQIWRGSLLLADWLIHNNRHISSDSYILELGSGVGLTSIIASMFAPVYCTDVNKGDLLKLIENNIKRNKHIGKYPLKVVELDFTAEELPKEVAAVLSKVEIILAADTIYDDHLTDAFVRTIQKLLFAPSRRTVYVALEKRFVFTIADCDAVAPCYDYFLRCLGKIKNIEMQEIPLDFPKYFKYDRAKELVLWKLQYCKHS
ncbi:hypothetical protein NQ317_009317 [Molorchus minor]|uniref:Methyltransferase-like protein 22 n=1 Tax=Molorchus minor TaxID=1323400 RepID=A0ABQ9ITN3_9CUCU|nr:hypothetical protein NQ317_009317 [Molorchus minor]